MPAVVVADSGVLIVLVKVGQLALLPSLFHRVIVPEEVWREVVGDGSRDGAPQLATQPWIDVARADPALVRAHASLVDVGEAAAIALAQREPDTLLLVDDARARKLALRLGIAIKGTLGVLVLAKRRGLLERVRPSLDELTRVGLYVSAALVEATLRAAGEDR